MICNMRTVTTEDAPKDEHHKERFIITKHVCIHEAMHCAEYKHKCACGVEFETEWDMCLRKEK